MALSKKLVGKRIVKVHQTRVQTNSGPAYHVDSIVLDDGSRITFHVREGENDYSIEALVHPPKELP